MPDKTLNDRIKAVRSECEEYFYMGSAFIDDKDKASAFAQVVLKDIKLKKISELKAQINLCENGITYKSKERNWEHAFGYDLGIQTANKSRKKTHEEAIAELTADIEILELNIL